MRELPPEIAARQEWLAKASLAELDEAIEERRRSHPELVAQVEAEFDPALVIWTADIELGDSVLDESAYVEVPLDEDAFLDALALEDDDVPAMVRLNVKPDDLGSWLDVDLVLGGSAKRGLRITAQYELEGEDAVLQRSADDTHMSASSRTTQRVGENESVTLRLVVAAEDVA